MDDVKFINPIVIDNGSGFMKAGFAGEERPKCHFPSYVGRPKHHRIIEGGAMQGLEAVVGPDVETLRGVLKCSYPMEHGEVKNWEDMEMAMKMKRRMAQAIARWEAEEEARRALELEIAVEAMALWAAEEKATSHAHHKTYP